MGPNRQVLVTLPVAVPASSPASIASAVALMTLLAGCSGQAVDGPAAASAAGYTLPPCPADADGWVAPCGDGDWTMDAARVVASPPASAVCHVESEGSPLRRTPTWSVWVGRDVAVGEDEGAPMGLRLGIQYDTRAMGDHVVGVLQWTDHPNVTFTWDASGQGFAEIPRPLPDTRLMVQGWFFRPSDAMVRETSSGNVGPARSLTEQRMWSGRGGTDEASLIMPTMQLAVLSNQGGSEQWLLLTQEDWAHRNQEGNDEPGSANWGANERVADWSGRLHGRDVHVTQRYIGFHAYLHDVAYPWYAADDPRCDGSGVSDGAQTSVRGPGDLDRFTPPKPSL